MNRYNFIKKSDLVKLVSGLKLNCCYTVKLKGETESVLCKRRGNEHLDPEHNHFVFYVERVNASRWKYLHVPLEEVMRIRFYDKKEGYVSYYLV